MRDYPDTGEDYEGLEPTTAEIVLSVVLVIAFSALLVIWAVTP